MRQGASLFRPASTWPRQQIATPRSLPSRLRTHCRVIVTPLTLALQHPAISSDALHGRIASPVKPRAASVDLKPPKADADSNSSR